MHLKIGLWSISDEFTKDIRFSKGHVTKVYSIQLYTHRMYTTDTESYWTNPWEILKSTPLNRVNFLEMAFRN